MCYIRNKAIPELDDILNDPNSLGLHRKICQLLQDEVITHITSEQELHTCVYNDVCVNVVLMYMYIYMYTCIEVPGGLVKANNF